jgi:hypothetical protein
MLRKFLGATLASGALALALVGPVGAANNAGDNLINVQVSDVTILVPVAVAADLCDINVNALADQVDAGRTLCDATAQSAASPGSNQSGGNTAGNSLVNVQLDDVFVAVPIAVAANVCDVNVNVLAQQLRLGQATCDASARIVPTA